MGNSGPANLVSQLSASPGARALRQMKQWIVEGTLASGDRMPAEETLTEELKVARTTVRRALRELEKQGLIVVEGRRRVVAPQSPTRNATIHQTVAMLAPPIPADTVSRAEPGWSYYIQMGVIDAVREAGLHLLHLSPELVDGPAITRLAKEGVRGLVAFRHATGAVATGSIIKAVHAAKVPVVVYGHDADVDSEITVASDHCAGEYKLTKLLIERGCRRILRLWSRPDTADRPGWIARRDEGYEQAMAEAGLEPLPQAGIADLKEIAAEAFQFETVSRLMMGYLAEHAHGSTRIDGICTLADGQAYAAAAACRRLGLVPDRDVLIVGYDNVWREAAEGHYEDSGPIATVDKRNRAIGRELVTLLLSSPVASAGQVEHRLVEPELVVIRNAALRSA